MSWIGLLFWRVSAIGRTKDQKNGVHLKTSVEEQLQSVGSSDHLRWLTIIFGFKLEMF